MTRNRDYDDTVGARAGSGIGDTTGTLWEGGAPTATRTPTMQDVDAALLELARNRKGFGVTADDVLRIMKDKGIAWSVDHTEQRKFSDTGRHLAKLARHGHLSPLLYSDGNPVTRKSDRVKAKGNRQHVYVIPQYARAG